jgi:hypothetical protein
MPVLYEASTGLEHYASPSAISIMLVSTYQTPRCHNQDDQKSRSATAHSNALAHVERAALPFAYEVFDVSNM